MNASPYVKRLECPVPAMADCLREAKAVSLRIQMERHEERSKEEAPESGAA